MTTKKPKKMVALKVLETSGVDHPAHLEEGWVVMKNAQEEEDMTDGIELDEQYIDRVVELEAELAKALETIAALKAQKSADPEDDEDEADAMLKSLPEPVREMLAKAQSEADFAREELRKEKEIQRDREYVAKASAWSNLQIDPSKFGKALREVADTNPELAKSIEQAFEAVNAQQEAAEIFAELGASNRQGTSNAFGKVTSLAKAAVDAGEYKTVEQAISGLVAQNPDLYNEYIAENR